MTPMIVRDDGGGPWVTYAVYVQRGTVLLLVCRDDSLVGTRETKPIFPLAFGKCCGDWLPSTCGFGRPAQNENTCRSIVR